MRSYYDVLECSANASTGELKAAYHRLLKRTHPDKAPNAQSGQLLLLQSAWHNLRESSQRRAYDFWLREQRLRENVHRIDQTLVLETATDVIDAECRCGALFEVSEEETQRIVDYALFECENCSLHLKHSERVAVISQMNTNTNKILVVGDGDVGKSTLVNTLCGTPDSRPESTVGVAIKVLAHQFAAGTPQESTEVIELWDVGGSTHHRATASRVFTDNVSGIIFVHDLNNARSEKNLAHWATMLDYLTPSLPSPQRYNEFNKSADVVENVGYLPTLVVGSGADQAHRARSTAVTKLGNIRHFESIALDCRKEIGAGSTNRLLISRFFDAVCVVKSRQDDPVAHQRRRRFL